MNPVAPRREQDPAYAASAQDGPLTDCLGSTLDERLAVQLRQAIGARVALARGSSPRVDRRGHLGRTGSGACGPSPRCLRSRVRCLAMQASGTMAPFAGR